MPPFLGKVWIEPGKLGCNQKKLSPKHVKKLDVELAILYLDISRQNACGNVFMYDTKRISALLYPIQIEFNQISRKRW